MPGADVSADHAPCVTCVPEGALCAALAPETASLEALFDLIDRVCDDCGATPCPKRARFDAKLALEELFVNVMRHGFGDGRPRANVEVSGWCEKGASPEGRPAALHFVMRDAGIPFDPLAYKAQRVSAGLGARNKVGGLGVFLVCERMDDVEYAYRDGHNTVHLVKYLQD